MDVFQTPHPALALLFLAWPLAIVVLFRLAGRRNAVVTAVVGGELFLPDFVYVLPVRVGPLRLELDRYMLTGLGLTLAVLVWDRATLRRFRPTRWDLAPLAFFAWMFCLSAVWAEGNVYFLRRMAWYAPVYLSARLYLGSLDGAIRVAVGIVAGTLALAPVVFYEAWLGPDWYLKGRLFGLPHAHNYARLGGFRPEAFFSHGLELSAWTAQAAVLSVWLWLTGAWRPRWCPAWVPPLVLLLATAVNRGVYAYIACAAGVTAAALTLGLRSRVPLVLLALVAPVYITARTGGLWDGRALVGLAGDRTRTVSIRLDAEDAVCREVLPHSPLIGMSRPLGLNLHSKPTAIAFPPTDSYWAFLLRAGGLVAMLLYYAGLYLMPVGKALERPPGRPTRTQAGSPAWGLALYLIGWMAYSAQNWVLFLAEPLACGVLVGMAATGQGADAWAGPRPRPSRRGERRQAGPRGPRPADDLAPAGVAAALACLIYAFYSVDAGAAAGAGRSLQDLVGGLGSAPLFAAAGWAGAWAAGRAGLGRLAVFAGLFALFGVSFNVALHPSTRPWLASDILQTLALSALVVAAVARAAGDRTWVLGWLALAPLVVDLVLRPRGLLPGFPGSEFLYGPPPGGGEPPVYSLCPWLAPAAVGAWARREGAGLSLAAAGLFGVGLVAAVAADPASGWPEKRPMNVTYALLALAVAAAALAAARVVASPRAPEAPRRFAAWLGRHWLVYFYLHFALAIALRSAPVRSPWLLGVVQGLGAVALTWLVVTATRPLSRIFRQPVAWAGLLAVILAAAAWPGLTGAAVLWPAGLAGLLFAVHAEQLLSLCGVASGRRATVGRAARARRGGENSLPADTPARVVLRLAVALALLTLPEAVDRLTPARPGSPATSPRDRGRRAAETPPPGPHPSPTMTPAS